LKIGLVLRLSLSLSLSLWDCGIREINAAARREIRKVSAIFVQMMLDEA
jgi:hypothetical protein